MIKLMNRNFFFKFLILSFVFTLILFFGLFSSGQTILAWEQEMFPGFQSAVIAGGQEFTYEVEVQQREGIKEGQINILFSELDANTLEILVEGDFAGEEFFFTAAGNKNSPADIFSNISTAMIMSLPPELGGVFMSTFSMAGMITGFYGDQFELGWQFVDDEDFGDEVLISIEEMSSFAGQEGYLIKMQDDREVFLEYSQSPEILLPLMVNFPGYLPDDEEFHDDYDWEDDGDEFSQGIFGEDFAARIELISFREDAVIAQELADRPSPQRILNELVEHFVESGLEVGERSMRGYSMMGAVAGFGVEIEGGEVELYLYDRENADEDLLENLNKAEESGKFLFAAMGMEIPVVINGDIMMTGLEFGSFYKHPAYDEVVDTFMKF